MSKKEFMGHCFCSSRYNTLLKSIETLSMDEVEKLYLVHKELPRNTKFAELQKTFEKRLNV